VTLRAPARPRLRAGPADPPPDLASFRTGQAEMLAEVEAWADQLGPLSSGRLRELVKRRRAELAGGGR
jgi:hypothetical protein